MAAEELKVAVVGSGPAGLMVATQLAKQGIKVAVFEKKRGPAAKLLLAGKSGLNVSNSRLDASNYDGPLARFQSLLKMFSVQDWLDFIKALGVPTFKGTSQRYFVEDLKAAPLLKNWIHMLSLKFFHPINIIT